MIRPEPAAGPQAAGPQAAGPQAAGPQAAGPQAAGAQANGTPIFEELLAAVMGATGRFGHREHVHLTWLAVRQCGPLAATRLVSEGIQRTARYAGAPQKYHVTVSRAWAELIGHHAAESGDLDFAAFADQYPALLDKRLLTRFYRPVTLASPRARTEWVEPDLAPFPWPAPVSGRACASEPRCDGRLPPEEGH